MQISPNANPFTPVDWRYQRCVHLIKTNRRPSRRNDDTAVWSGFRFLNGLGRCGDDRSRERVHRRFPLLSAAHELRSSSNTFQRWAMEGYLLAGVTPLEIDTHFGLQAGTTQCYAEQFFDITDCLGACDYLANVVIGLYSRPVTEKDADVFIRLFGLTGGRHAVDALLDYYHNPLTDLTDLSEMDAENFPRALRHLWISIAIRTHCLDVRDPILFDLLLLVEGLGKASNAPAS